MLLAGRNQFGDVQPNANVEETLQGHSDDCVVVYALEKYEIMGYLLHKLD